MELAQLVWRMSCTREYWALICKITQLGRMSP